MQNCYTWWASAQSDHTGSPRGLQAPCCQVSFLHVLLSFLRPLLMYEVCQSSWHIQVLRALLSLPSTFCEGWTTNMEKLDWVPHITCSQPTTISPSTHHKSLWSTKNLNNLVLLLLVSFCTSNSNSVTWLFLGKTQGGFAQKLGWRLKNL